MGIMNAGTAFGTVIAPPAITVSSPAELAVGLVSLRCRRPAVGCVVVEAYSLPSGTPAYGAGAGQSRKRSSRLTMWWRVISRGSNFLVSPGVGPHAGSS